MCGIYIYPETIEKNVTTEESVKKRGPDGYHTLIRGGYVFNHALLSLTGGYALQPANNENFTILFNGEIYNYKLLGDFSSEIECLSVLYKELYLDLPREIDGEYVIVIFDWARAELVIFSDVFGTKPMFVNLLEKGVELASVPSVNQRFNGRFACDIPPNSVTVINLKSKKIKLRFNHHFFRLSQTVDNFDFWNEAFLSAIKKRVPGARTGREPEPLFIGLSSGYDSGSIAAALKYLNIRFTAYTVMNPNIWEDIFKRSKIITDNANHILISDHRKSKISFEEPEDFPFTIYSQDGTYKEIGSSTKTDSGAKGLGHICSHAKLLKHRVYLSGSGADEIYSDYGFKGKKIFSHSNFGGLFKESLQGYFPWPSFFSSTMRAYLMKEELVAGSFGIEGRYPFLDTQLVQAWISVTSSLKNSQYKGALALFMKNHDFYFSSDVKLGF